MKKRYLKTVDDVLALKDTDTKIYEEVGSRYYYKFIKGVLCCFDKNENKWQVNTSILLEDEPYILEEDPEQEATEDDIDTLCKFWDNDENDFIISILRSIDIASQTDSAFVDDFDVVWIHCRKLLPSEVAELTGYKVEEAE